MPRVRKPQSPSSAIPHMLQPNAAGVDIGATEIYIAVPAGRDSQTVRCFRTFTADLQAAADWLRRCSVESVAMESTGVYWIPFFQILEASGFEVFLVNARHVKNVPGRKTDVSDCQWLQYLHSVGLLRAAFRPDGDVCAVRSLMRHRSELVAITNQHIQHMHKALTQMNVQVQHVISDITGVTGLAIVDAILDGKRDPAELAKLRNKRIQVSEEVIRKSLVGSWGAEHLFTLKQSRESYQHYQQQINACDEEIQKRIVTFAPRVDPVERPLPPNRKRKDRGRKTKKVTLQPGQAGFDLRTESYKLFGVDLTQIPGLMAMVLTLFSELGRDMSRWPTAGQFVGWLALCPDNDISGGRILWRGRRKAQNRAGQLFRMAAYTLHHEQSPLGDYLRRMKSRIGPAGATTATARKIAVIFYTMVKNQVEYDASIWAERDAERDKRFEAKLKRQAQQRGYKLVPIEQKPAA